MSKEISGIIPIVAAAFTRSGVLDEDSFQCLIRHLIATNASALTLFGLATEFYKLTDDERARMQRLLLAETSRFESVAGIISITDHSWEVACQRARGAEAQGADALMLLPPYFLGPSEDAILEHLKRVIGSVMIPIIVQYAPMQTGVRIAPEVFLKLRDLLPNADFIKVETQPPGRYVSQLVERSEGRLKSLVGYAGVQMPDVLARGAVGIQPGCSFTEIYMDLWQLWQADKTKFMTLHNKLLPYINYWMQGVELIIKVEKVILKQRGIIASDYCRSPSYDLDEHEQLQIEQFMIEFAEWLK
jgi:dihydrodipicolinate synthase/N-acetylneuraminate lyase